MPRVALGLSTPGPRAVSIEPINRCQQRSAAWRAFLMCSLRPSGEADAKPQEETAEKKEDAVD
eukprot:10234417-Alexandrium_andersonii.AAC.1